MMIESLTSTLLNRIIKNMSWLFLSQALISVLGLATLMVTARALGPASLGILALVESYVQVCNRFLRMEPWQSVIRYGADALSKDDMLRFRRLIKLSIVIDLLGGILAGCVALALASYVAPIFGLPDAEGASYIMFVAIGLFFSLQPTGIAVLRVFDRFDVLAKSDAAIAGVRLIIAIMALLFDLGIWAFLALMLMHQILTGLVAFFLAMRELGRRGLLDFRNLNLSEALSENPGFLRFLWNSNFNVVLRQSTQRIDVLLVGALLDVRAVGFYQVGKRIMTSVIRIGRPMQQVFYPELTRLWSRGDRDQYWRLVRYAALSISALACLISVPLALQMPTVARLLFGEEFVAAAPVMTILMFAAVVYLGSVVLNPTLLSMGLDRALVRSTIAATIVFAIAYFPLVLTFGITGAAVNHLIFNLVWLSGCVLSIRAVVARERPDHR